MFRTRTKERDRSQALKDLPLFARCSRQELRRLDRIMTEVYVPAGRILTHIGEPGDEFFIIRAGKASVWCDGVELDVLGPGSFFGEIALLGRSVRTANVVADTEMRLLVMSRREFRSTHFLVAHVAEAMLNEVSRRLSRADEGWATSETRREGVRSLSR